MGPLAKRYKVIARARFDPTGNRQRLTGRAQYGARHAHHRHALPAESEAQARTAHAIIKEHRRLQGGWPLAGVKGC